MLTEAPAHGKPPTYLAESAIPAEIVELLPHASGGKNGKVAFCCPIHGDEHQSAVCFPPNDKGFVNLYCSAGCDPRAIAAALGITSKMLGGHAASAIPRTTFGPTRPQFQKKQKPPRRYRRAHQQARHAMVSSTRPGPCSIDDSAGSDSGSAADAGRQLTALRHQLPMLRSDALMGIRMRNRGRLRVLARERSRGAARGNSRTLIKTFLS
jgi:hypothetical protein